MIERKGREDLPIAKLEQIVKDVCLVRHDVNSAYARTDEESGYTFWIIQCEEFSLTFTNKPDVKMANIWPVPALKPSMTWDEVADAIIESEEEREE